MFYRMRLDAYIGEVLKQHGYSHSEQMIFWPSGETAKWIEVGKRNNLAPHETAAVAVCAVAKQKLAAGEIDRNTYESLAQVAIKLLLKLGYRLHAYNELKKHLPPRAEFVLHTLSPNTGYKKQEWSLEEMTNKGWRREQADENGNAYLIEAMRSGEKAYFSVTRERFEMALREHQRLDNMVPSVDEKRAEIEQELNRLKKKI